MSQKTSEDNLLTPDELASQLNVSSGTLAVWRSNGTCQIPYIKIGRCVRYKSSAVKRFLQQQEHLHTHLKTGGK